jgi:4-diphosphocytidyl-2-C-methyl-D-erythritol kinase
MGVEGRSSVYKSKTPAKLNFRLKITGRRLDGYHELISLMVPIGLSDLLEFKVIPKGIELTCEGLRVPTDSHNLAFQAAQSFLSKTGIREGISIRLVKRIPVAAGLGGGSSDAAATLLTLNEIWSRPLSLKDLHGLATQLGADVPFFLYCRPSLAMGIGELLEPLNGWPRLWYVLVAPDLQVSTSWAFKSLKLRLTSGEYDHILNFLRHDPLPISHILENDLEEVTSANYPIIDTIKKLLINAGAEGALMTGSGPCVFGVFLSSTQATSASEFLISQRVGDVFVATNWEGN